MSRLWPGKPARTASRMRAQSRDGRPQVTPAGHQGRFPGFEVTDQAPHWDQATAAAVTSRLGPPPDLRFFTPAEEVIATALTGLLLGQEGQARTAGPTLLGAPAAGELDQPRVHVVPVIDARLTDAQTDGWRYADMPEDGQAWRDTLGYLDADAQARYGRGFAVCPAADQSALIQAVQDLGSGNWHGLTASRVWSLWTRYACTAFYAHPWAWNEIGFPGPAYPRGYKNIGVGKREPFEVADAAPADDPVRAGRARSGRVRSGPPGGDG